MNEKENKKAARELIRLARKFLEEHRTEEKSLIVQACAAPIPRGDVPSLRSVPMDDEGHAH